MRGAVVVYVVPDGSVGGSGKRLMRFSRRADRTVMAAKRNAMISGPSVLDGLGGGDFSSLRSVLEADDPLLFLSFSCVLICRCNYRISAALCNMCISRAHRR